jgi:hypothetical protein
LTAQLLLLLLLLLLRSLLCCCSANSTLQQCHCCHQQQEKHLVRWQQHCTSQQGLQSAWLPQQQLSGTNPSCCLQQQACHQS